MVLIFIALLRFSFDCPSYDSSVRVYLTGLPLARPMLGVTEKNNEGSWTGWPVTQPRFELGHPNTSLQRYRYTLDRHVIRILKLGDRGVFEHSPSGSIESSNKSYRVSR